MQTIAFRIDRHSGVAAYQQLVHQVRQALRLGTLEPGDRLPTTKEVVADLAINPHTVLKAYRELEREGLVEPRPGRGTFITRSLARPEAAAGAPLRTELTGWVSRAHATGLDRDDIAAMTEAALDESYGPRPLPPVPVSLAGARSTPHSHPHRHSHPHPHPASSEADT
ncbi:GntR family transcriptional regulator [Streptomyces varsoviensis]|uniref:GntR family transcriptional regulator n=1 Tax=Streptomyces varsoviensis TaxID=67373 RepID=UPI000996FAA0|nr:GntR family transcriptional regulator [Streptomyces varsoviensis]